MTKKLTVSELSAKLGVSVNTIWKKIKKRGLTTVKDTVNNRIITFVLLTDEQLNDLLQDQISINQVNNGGNSQNYEDSETSYEGVINTGKSSEAIALMDKILEFSKDMLSETKVYLDRAATAEAQVKLLEDSENRKNSEYHKLIAENKELKLRVQELEDKVKHYEALWWNKPFSKK